MRLLVSVLAWFLRAVFASRRSLALENLALRQQLAIHARTQKRPRLKPGERESRPGATRAVGSMPRSRCPKRIIAEYGRLLALAVLAESHDIGLSDSAGQQAASSKPSG